jgi:hypothetical protein
VVLPYDIWKVSGGAIMIAEPGISP